MKLREMKLPSNILLAPMYNVTTTPFRRFCRHFYNLGLVMIPMIHTDRLIKNLKSIEYKFLKIEQENPISVQLVGNNADSFKEAATILESYDFDMIDINAGCPSEKSDETQHGAFLLRDLHNLKKIIKSTLKYSSKEVSLKIRIGLEDPLKLKELKNAIGDLDLSFITVHGRTVKGRFDRSELNLEFIKNLKHEISIPIIANGDINSPEFAKHVLTYTNVDGIMIGRGCIGDPLIFERISNHLSKSEYSPFINSIGMMESNISLYEKILDHYLEEINLPMDKQEYKFRELRRNSIWLTKGIKSAVNLRNKLNQVKNMVQLRDFYKETFQSNPLASLA